MVQESIERARAALFAGGRARRAARRVEAVAEPLRLAELAAGGPAPRLPGGSAGAAASKIAARRSARSKIARLRRERGL